MRGGPLGQQRGTARASSAATAPGPRILTGPSRGAYLAPVRITSGCRVHVFLAQRADRLNPVHHSPSTIMARFGRRRSPGHPAI